MISAGGRSLGREATKGEACLVAARWALVIVVTVRRDKLVREVNPGDRAQPRGTRRMPDGGARATRDRSMLTWHTAGGTGSEPSILLLRKPLLGVADRTRLHERRSHLQVQVRDGDACLEWLPIAFPFTTGPRVRIRLPPGERCYGAGGEDGNFVAYINRWSARCPSRTI